MKIGDIKINKLYKKYIWIVCPDCGREGWVRMKNGKPEYIYCHRCSTLRLAKNPVILYPKRSDKKAYIQDYGEDLESHFDSAENVVCPERIFCRDCSYHCNDWKNCPIRTEALEIVKEKK